MATKSRILNKNAVKWHLKQLLLESIIHRQVVLGLIVNQVSAAQIVREHVSKIQNGVQNGCQHQLHYISIKSFKNIQALHIQGSLKLLHLYYVICPLKYFQ